MLVSRNKQHAHFGEYGEENTWTKDGISNRIQTFT